MAGLPVTTGSQYIDCNGSNQGNIIGDLLPVNTDLIHHQSITQCTQYQYPNQVALNHTARFCESCSGWDPGDRPVRSIDDNHEQNADHDRSSQNRRGTRSG